jgi:hypothetical protein
MLAFGFGKGLSKAVNVTVGFLHLYFIEFLEMMACQHRREQVVLTIIYMCILIAEMSLGLTGGACLYTVYYYTSEVS